jgi:hypothetical protein
VSRAKPPWIAAEKAKRIRNERRRERFYSILAIVLVAAAGIGGVVARFREMNAVKDKMGSRARPQATNEFVPRNSTN